MDKKSLKLIEENYNKNFEEFFEDFMNHMNKESRESYDKKSKIGKFFSSRNNFFISKLNKHMAENFYEKGRLQAVCEIRKNQMEDLNSN